MYFDFALMSSDQIQQLQMALHERRADEVPLVIRARPAPARLRGQHSQTLESMFCHIPGLYVVYPATLPTRKHAQSAIRDNNPILFVESQALYV